MSGGNATEEKTRCQRGGAGQERDGERQRAEGSGQRAIDSQGASDRGTATTCAASWRACAGGGSRQWLPIGAPLGSSRALLGWPAIWRTSRLCNKGPSSWMSGQGEVEGRSVGGVGLPHPLRETPAVSRKSFEVPNSSRRGSHVSYRTLGLCGVPGKLQRDVKRYSKLYFVHTVTSPRSTTWARLLPLWGCLGTAGAGSAVW